MIDGEGKLTFNKVTEFGVTTPVRTIDEWGMFAGLGYTYVPNDFIVNAHVTVATPQRDFGRTVTIAVHTAVTAPKRAFTRTTTIAVNFVVSKLGAFNRTLTENVHVATSVGKDFSRTIVENVLLSVGAPSRDFTRTITVPVNFVVLFLRNAGFIMKTKAVSLFYGDHRQVK
jgi:hypothetical protein